MVGHTEVLPAVREPVLSVTAFGKAKEKELVHAADAKAGQDIVLSRWIGMEGSVVIAAAKEAELLERFPKAMIDSIKALLPNCKVSGLTG